MNDLDELIEKGNAMSAELRDVAGDANDSGSLAEASRLYELAAEWDSVVEKSA